MEQAKALLALAQRFLCLFALGDVCQKRAIVDQSAGVVEDRLREDLDGHATALLAHVLLLVAHGSPLRDRLGEQRRLDLPPIRRRELDGQRRGPFLELLAAVAGELANA